MANELVEGLSYAGSEPDMVVIPDIYQQDVSNHSGFADQCRDSRNQRVNWWPGKTLDQRKHGVDAKPWPNASDVEVPAYDVRANTLIAYAMNAIRDGNITALPVGSDDPEQSASTSTFCRWMLDTWIPRAYDHIELSLNNMGEKGFAATWVGWEEQPREHLEKTSLELIAAQDMERAELFADPDRVDEAIATLQNEYDFVDEKKAKKALKQLRETGEADIPVVKNDINRPVIEAKCPRADIIFPSWTMNVEDVSRVHIRHFMDIQGLRSAQFAEGWNKQWVDEVEDKYMGVTQGDIEGQYGNRNPYFANQTATLFNAGNRNAEELVEVVRTIQRLVDKKTGAIGYYHTVWCPKQMQATNKRKTSKVQYGTFELLNGWDELPIALTTLSRDSKNIYDQRTWGDLMRGNQAQAKIARDSWNDQQSIHSNPPRMHPAGRPASMWGAGATFAARRGEEGLYRTLDVPDTLRTGVERETFLAEEADAIMGLSEDSQNSIARRQEFVNRALDHVAEIVRLAYKAFQKFYDGPDLYFRVTGVPDPQVFNNTYFQEELDVKMVYDVRLGDKDYVKEKTELLLQLANADTNGTFDRDQVLQVAAYLNIPQFAGRILRPKQEAEADIVKNVADDLTLIWAGNTVNARPTGANVALNYIQGYAQQESIIRRTQEDQNYSAALNAYIQQYQMQIQQQQNAVTGRLGAPQQDINNV